MRWIGQSAWALADQGFTSFGNFLVSVLLARTLDTVAYGGFAVAYQCIWLFVTVHASVIAEPLLVLAPGRYRSHREEYLRTVMLGQTGFALLTGAVSGMVAAIAWWLGSVAIAGAFAGLALAVPAVLTLLSLRRAAYGCFQARASAIGSAANLVLIAVGLLVLDAIAGLGVFTAFLVVGMAAAVVSLGLWRWLGIGNPLASPWPLARSVLRRHRRYAGWGLAAGALAWVPGNAYYLILPLLPGPAFGLQATATLRALANLIMPLLQANAALGNSLIPVLSARRREGRRSGVAPLIVGLASFSALCWLGLILFGEPLVRWLYGGRYETGVSLLAWLGLIPIVTAVTQMLRGFLLAHERPDRMFWAYLVASIATFVGLVLVLRYGLHGVLAAMSLAPVAQIAAMLWFARRTGLRQSGRRRAVR
jgi:O-antigen/teichoic acid export membrane protein